MISGFLLDTICGTGCSSNSLYFSTSQYRSWGTLSVPSGVTDPGSVCSVPDPARDEKKPGSDLQQNRIGT